MNNYCENGVAGYEVDYDKRVEKSGYLIPELLFGLMYELVLPGSLLLDIGTGTGRVAKLFSRAGAFVHGMDKSDEMLKICKEKVNYESLTKHDIFDVPYPYETESMNHISCVGVLNHIEDLSVIFKECSRVLCNGGYFGVMTGYKEEDFSGEQQVQEEGFCYCMYGHSDSEINQYMKENNFILKRSLQTSVRSSVKQDIIMPVKVYVAQKI